MFTDENKKRYVMDAKEGTIIAFERIDEQDLQKYKVLSGMIVNIHEGSFDVKTKNGRMFNVPKHSVVWVKTGRRWPNGVYQALRGDADVKAK